MIVGYNVAQRRRERGQEENSKKQRMLRFLVISTSSEITLFFLPVQKSVAQGHVHFGRTLFLSVLPDQGTDSHLCNEHLGFRWIWFPSAENISTAGKTCTPKHCLVDPPSSLLLSWRQGTVIMTTCRRSKARSIGRDRHSHSAKGYQF